MSAIYTFAEKRAIRSPILKSNSADAYSLTESLTGLIVRPCERIGEYIYREIEINLRY